MEKSANGAGYTDISPYRGRAGSGIAGTEAQSGYRVRRGFARWMRFVSLPAALVLVCGIVVVAFRRLGAELSYEDLVRAVRRTPLIDVGTALGMTALSYLALAGTDWCATRYVRVAPARGVLLLASFCGYALGNATGFGSLSGAAVRYRIYSVAEMPPLRIGQIVAYLAFSFTAGATIVAALWSLVAAADVAAITGFPAPVVRASAAVAAALVALFLLAPQKLPSVAALGPLRLRLPETRLMAGQLALTAVDLAAAGAVLWFLLPPGRPPFLGFEAVYIVALLLGAASHLPGGIGVFEAAILTGLGQRIPASEVAAAVLVYRGVYFLLPVCLAAGLLAGYEVRRAAAARSVTSAVAPAARAAARLTPLFLGVLVFVAGSILVFSGATPAFSSRIALLESALPLWLVEASNFLGSVAGVVLLFVARGLMHRLDGAWWMALILAAAAFLFSLASGIAIVQASLIGFIMAVLLVTREQFRRPTSLLRQPMSATWLVAVALVIAISVGLLFFAFLDVQYRHSLWWEFAFNARAPRALRAVTGGAVAAMALAIWQLLRPPVGRTVPPTALELAAARAILRRQERASANLVMLADKSLLFSKSGASFLMYSRRGRTWVALYEPVGPRWERRELVSRFIEMVDAHRGRVAFYQVRPESLPIFLDAGLSIRKVGEEARVDLAAFSLDGPARSGLRYAHRRGTREGLTFELVPAGRVDSLLPALTAISAAWLDERRCAEKGFSVARFEPGFLRTNPVALLRQAGRPIAFAGVMTTELQAEAALGLMRHEPNRSGYAMEFLLTELLLELKRKGYRFFNLGMAPLGGLQVHPLTATWHRVAHLLSAFGGQLYNFQGLRAFKSKFDPVWEPRYLAASGTFGPYLALADTAMITGRGLRGVLAR